MPKQRVCSEIELVNGSTGDPVLYMDYPGQDDALLFDAGDNSLVSLERLGDLTAVFITHHHVDHFIGLDRIIRANIDSDKVLSLFGPDGTIAKVYARIKSYEYQYFPFQKIVLQVHELLDDRIRSAQLECRRRFPAPSPGEQPWDGGAIFESDNIKVFAAACDHTVPCWAYAAIEKPGYQLNRQSLDKGLLKPGDWIDELIDRIRNGDSNQQIDIQGGTFRTQDLARQYLKKSQGSKIGYVVDTAWSEQSKPRLQALVRNAHRLYCDSFYLEAQTKQAEKYRHMTALRAAQLAVSTNVGELVLIHFSKRYQGRYHLLIDEAQTVFDNTTAMT